MAVVLYEEKERKELLQYSRPENATYQTEFGNVLEVQPDVPRIEYKDGLIYGLKFGDGDTATFSYSYNEAWPQNDQNRTLMVMYNAPGYNLFVKSGDLELYGYGMMKLVIMKLDNTFHLEPSVEVAPGAENFEESDSHLLTYKLYLEDIDFNIYKEYQVMLNFNNAVHGEWSQEWLAPDNT